MTNDGDDGDQDNAYYCDTHATNGCGGGGGGGAGSDDNNDKCKCKVDHTTGDGGFGDAQKDTHNQITHGGYSDSDTQRYTSRDGNGSDGDNRHTHYQMSSRVRCRRHHRCVL